MRTHRTISSAYAQVLLVGATCFFVPGPRAHEPVTPGMRLGSLQECSGCTAAGIPYDRYIGIVE